MKSNRSTGNLLLKKICSKKAKITKKKEIMEANKNRVVSTERTVSSSSDCMASLRSAPTTKGGRPGTERRER